MEKSGFDFPTNGWHFAYSDSMGTDMLYHGMRVVERIFNETEHAAAFNTYEFLKDNGITTAQFQPIKHAPDQQPHFYVFAERSQMLEAKERLFPSIEISERERFKPLLKNLWAFIRGRS
jgi:hypothetical protein